MVIDVFLLSQLIQQGELLVLFIVLFIDLRGTVFYFHNLYPNDDVLVLSIILAIPQLLPFVTWITITAA